MLPQPQGDHAQFVALNGTTIDGNLEVDHLLSNPPATGLNFMCDSLIGKNLQIQNSSSDSPWDIGQLSTDTPVGPCAAANLVKGNLQFQNNGAQGLISHNSINGNLECANDIPPASGVPGSNTVGGHQLGECSGL